MTRGALPTTPVENSPPKITKPKTVAAGIPAVYSTLKHGLKKMGTISSIRNFNRVNKFNGFDCPGCAWPDPASRSIAEFCENGAKAIADESTKNRANPDFWSKWTVKELSEKPDFWLNNQGRITHPMVLHEGEEKYQAIDWNGAFQIIADKLAGLSNPDQALFYTSGRTSNEAAFLWQLLARSFGTNNLPDCSNMCHESSGVALNQSIGIGKGTVKLEDFSKSDLIIVIGQNPGTNHPRMLSTLRDAKLAGASVISINPLVEAGMGRFKHPQKPLDILGRGSKIADEHLIVDVNGDQALFRGFSKYLISNKSIDEKFIQEFTTGFEEYSTIVEETSWSQIESNCGIDKDSICRVASYIANSKSIICCWAMGLTQHKNSVSTIQEITNFCLLRGNIGRPGAGLCPVRGHSNVQGDRTVGINHDPPQYLLDGLLREFGVPAPENIGSDAVESVIDMISGSAKVFLSMGGNFLSAMSDSVKTAEALKHCELTVQISTKPNRSHLVTGKTALILPCLGRTEIDESEIGLQFVTVENSMGVVHSSVGHARPASHHLMSETSIVAGIGHALQMTGRGNEEIDWKSLGQDNDLVRSKIEKVIPGFNDFNIKCRVDGGFYLPNPPRDGRVFETETNKANFISSKLNSISISEGRYCMMTIRSHDQYNTTIYGLDDRYRGISKGRRVVLMNIQDMEEEGFHESEIVDISSHFNGRIIKSQSWFVVPYDIPRRNVATYFPESNVLIPIESVAEGSNTPTSKSVEVSIAKSSELP